ncbi:MAG: hypothetical protein ACRDZ8_04550 [Acidimicrobiales bacterium]
MCAVQLTRVYWIGGGSGAGKSTVARRIAASRGWTVYSTDDTMAEHVGRSTLQTAPYLHRFIEMSMDDRWVNRSPETMLNTFPWFRGEGFPLVLQDLRALPPEPPAVAEGFRLLPGLVRPLLANPANAVWLLPTPEFRQAAFASRDSRSDIPGRTADADRARRNLLERDRLFTGRIAEEVRHLGLSAIKVDAPTTEEQLLTQVLEALGLGGASPSA